jgi:hypothetical protein
MNSVNHTMPLEIPRALPSLNFRDISEHNALIRPGKVFRSSLLIATQNERWLNELFISKGIKAILDLRAAREIEQAKYTKQFLENLNYTNAQFDPWNQPGWFKQNHQQGTNEEIAYRYFGLACKEKIKIAIEAIVSETQGAVIVHCVAGKDRTGILISILHLLVGASLDVVITDYLTCEEDMKLSNLKIVLDIIENEGGIERYLRSCGLSERQLMILREKITK